MDKGPARQAGPTIWPSPLDLIDIDVRFRARPPLPGCPHCGGLARPNVLMFGDSDWLEHRTEEQHARYAAWRREIRGRELVVLEIGAGITVPTVRLECEQASGTLIRINPREPDVRAGAIAIKGAAATVLATLNNVIAQ